MINEKYNEQEINNINEIENILNNYNGYINIEPNGSKTLQFILSKKIEEVEKTYNGQTIKKIRFIVKEQNGDNKEKFLDIGKRSAKLIITKLKEGNTLLKIERIGSGKDTLYVPTVESSNNQ